MKKKDNIVRIGDKVIVEVPNVFIRCGYNYTITDMIRTKMHIDDADKIDNLLHSVGVNKSGGKEYNSAFDTIVKAIARYKLWENNWGGDERKIFIKHIPNIINYKYEVIGKRTVQTGKRKRGYYDSYYGDGESPSFKSSGSHVILDLQKVGAIPKLMYVEGKSNDCMLDEIWDYINTYAYDDDIYHIQIERANVKKLWENL
jgi:hypothetical protein